MLEGLLGASGEQLAPLKEERPDLFLLRVRSGPRLLFQYQIEMIAVVDVVRRSQIDGLRRAMRASVTPDQASGPCLA
ncbi:MAG: hypothetical protein K2X46_01700 [Roseomonas sp.]|nr:hypothetical protein [Roseomonas sp.]